MGTGSGGVAETAEVINIEMKAAQNRFMARPFADGSEITHGIGSAKDAGRGEVQDLAVRSVVRALLILQIPAAPNSQMSMDAGSGT